MHRLWPSGSSPAHRHGFQSAPRSDHLSWAFRPLPQLFQRAHPLPTNTCPVPTITDGYARARWPQRLFTWLYVEPSPFCVRVRGRWRQGQVNLERHSSSSRSSLRPWVCHNTRELTVLSRVSSRPFHLNIDRFHQPCLSPGRHPG